MDDRLNELTVVEWIDVDDSDDKEEAVGGVGGWFNFKDSGQRWRDFLEFAKLEEVAYYEALRARVLQDGIRYGGDWHQTSGVPLFSDGKVAGLSFRAWGDFLAAVWSEKEDKDYNYTHFYMCGHNGCAEAPR